MDMVERVARAMVESRNLPDGCEINWAAFYRDARAAIAAMREPTPEMVRAGDAGIDECYNTGYGTQDIVPSAETVWENMIDAALTSSEKG